MSSATSLKPSSYMAKPQIYKIFRLAKELYKMVPDGKPLEDWMETKLAITANDIGNVYDALKHDRDNSAIHKIAVGYNDADADPSYEGLRDYLGTSSPSIVKRVNMDEAYKAVSWECWKRCSANGFPKHIPNCVQECAMHIARKEASLSFRPYENRLSESAKSDIELHEGYVPVEIYMQMLAEAVRGGKIVVEAVYKGRKVELNKPKRGGSKKFYVYVNSGRKNAEGEIVAKKVSFGDPNMEIRRDDPKRRANFRKRHNCADAKDKTTARYWSCRFWSKNKVGDMA